MRTSSILRTVCLQVSLLFVLIACGGNGRSAAPAPASGRIRPAIQRGAIADVPLPAELHSVPVRTLDQISFEFSWDLVLPAAVHTSWIGPDIPELLFFQLVTGEIHGIDARSGMTRFVTEPLPALLEYEADVVRHRRIIRRREDREHLYDDRFYVIVQNQLICFEANSGHVLWRFDLPFEPSSGPAAQGNHDNVRVFIGDWAGRIRVVSYDTEKEKPYVRWQWNLQGAVPQAPAIGMDNRVYVVDRSGGLHSFNLDRDHKWSFAAHGPLHAQPTLRGRSLYLGADDHVLHVLNRLTGEQLGQIYLDAPLRRKPMIFANEPTAVFVWTDGPSGGLHAVRTEPDTVPFTDVAEDRHPLEVERLARMWFVPHLSRLVGSSPRQLYCTAADNSEIIAVDKRSGNLDWRWDISQDLGMSPQHIVSYVDYDDLLRSIMAVGADGRVVSYRIFGQYSR